MSVCCLTFEKFIYKLAIYIVILLWVTISFCHRYELAEAEEVASKLSPLENKSAPKEEPVKTPETEKQSEEKKTDGPGR